MNLDTPTAAVTAGVLFGAIKRGWGDLDFAALYKLQEESDAVSATALPAGSAQADANTKENDEPLATYGSGGSDEAEASSTPDADAAADSAEATAQPADAPAKP